MREIRKNIYEVTVPLPNNPLRNINVYIIKGARSLVIDTGFNRPECEETLRNAFKKLGIQFPDFFITHLHSDHCGLVSTFAGEKSKIYAGETDGELINFEAGNLYWRILDDLFIKYGFPKAEFGRNTDVHPGRKYCHQTSVNFTFLDETDVLSYGGYELMPVETPGHTPGHMCLYDSQNKILFGGDHILGTITPNICIDLSNENPLKDYLESLDKVNKMDVALLLSAHGTQIKDIGARIKELKEHHRDRLAEAEKLLGNEEKTAFEVARDMTWEIDCGNWDAFPVPQKWFATGEAIAHLQYLYFDGRVIKEERKGIYFYSKK